MGNGSQMTVEVEVVTVPVGPNGELKTVVSHLGSDD